MPAQDYQLSVGILYIAVCLDGKALFVGKTDELLTNTESFRQLSHAELPLRPEEYIVDINFAASWDTIFHLATIITNQGRVFAKGHISPDGKEFSYRKQWRETLEIDQSPYIEVDLSTLTFANDERIVASCLFLEPTSVFFFTNQGSIFCTNIVDGSTNYTSWPQFKTPGLLSKVPLPFSLEPSERLTGLYLDNPENATCSLRSACFFTSQSRVIEVTRNKWVTMDLPTINQWVIRALPININPPNNSFTVLGHADKVETLSCKAAFWPPNLQNLIKRQQNTDFIQLLSPLERNGQGLVICNKFRILTNRGYCYDTTTDPKLMPTSHILLTSLLEAEKIIVSAAYKNIVGFNSFYLTNYGRLFYIPDVDDTFLYQNKYLYQFAHPMSQMTVPKPYGCKHAIQRKTYVLGPWTNTGESVAASYTPGEFLVKREELSAGMMKLTTQRPTANPYPQPETSLRTLHCKADTFTRQGLAADVWTQDKVETAYLPDEMLLEIFSNFTPQELTRVAQVCRRFYHIALSAGYQHHLKPLNISQGIMPIRELRTLLANIREMQTRLPAAEQQAFRTQVLNCLGPQSRRLLHQPDLWRVLPA